MMEVCCIIGFINPWRMPQERKDSMPLSEPTPAILAVSMLLSARNYIKARGDGSQNTIGSAMWAVLDELRGEELAVATMLVRIDNERTRAAFASLCASCW